MWVDWPKISRDILGPSHGKISQRKFLLCSRGERHLKLPHSSVLKQATVDRKTCPSINLRWTQHVNTVINADVQLQCNLVLRIRPSLHIAYPRGEKY